MTTPQLDHLHRNPRLHAYGALLSKGSSSPSPDKAQSIQINGVSHACGMTCQLSNFLDQWDKDYAGRGYSFGVTPGGRLALCSNGEAAYYGSGIASADSVKRLNNRWAMLLGNATYPYHRNLMESLSNSNPPLSDGSVETIAHRLLPDIDPLSQLDIQTPQWSVEVTLQAAAGSNISVVVKHNGTTASTDSAWATLPEHAHYFCRLKGAISKDGKKFILGWRFEVTDPFMFDAYTDRQFKAVIMRGTFSDFDTAPTITGGIVDAGAMVTS